MSKNKEQEKNGHTGGLVVGIILGAALGALLTPVDGKKAREELARKTKPLRKKAKTAVLKAKETEVFKEVTEAVETAVSEKTAEVKEKLPFLSKIEEAVSSTIRPPKTVASSVTKTKKGSPKLFKGVKKS